MDIAMPTKLKLKRVEICDKCVALVIPETSGPAYCMLGYNLKMDCKVPQPIALCPKPLNTNELAGIIAIKNLIDDNFQVEMKLEPVNDNDKSKPYSPNISMIACDCIHQNVCVMHNDMSMLRLKLLNVARKDWSCHNIGQTVQIMVQCSFYVDCPDVHDGDGDIS